MSGPLIDTDSALTGGTQRLFELAYDHLRELAARQLRRERAGHTLQPTALVHEAFFKLVDQSQIQWESRSHFIGIAVRAMRQVLIEYARKRHALKRGGELQRITLNSQISAGENATELDLIAVDTALTQLAEKHPRCGRVVELRLFGGLTMEEISEVTGVSIRTVHGDWSFSKMWLSRELDESG